MLYFTYVLTTTGLELLGVSSLNLIFPFREKQGVSEIEDADRT